MRAQTRLLVSVSATVALFFPAQVTAGAEEPPPVEAAAATVTSETGEEGVRVDTHVTSANVSVLRSGSGTQCSEADGIGTQVCMTVGADAPPVGPIPSGRAIQQFPAWCLASERNVMHQTRTEACGIYDAYLSITRTSGNVTTEVGAMALSVYRYTYTSTNMTDWATQIQLSPNTIRGEAAGTRFSGVATCTGGCTTETSSFPIQIPRLHENANGEAHFSSPVLPGGISQAVLSWSVVIDSPTAQNVVNGYWGGAPTVRCDQALRGSMTSGCVIPETAVELVYSYGQWPTFGYHLPNAEFSGLPGSWYSGRPLHRLTDDALIQRNRDTACHHNAAFERPDGLTCDEYPFASSWEGAFTGGAGPGRTFALCHISTLPQGVMDSAGYSSCMIDGAENSRAGSIMHAQLFVPYRILEGDPFDVTVEM
jgi:hypothetical protein